jgi:predicted aspartyl protease
MPVEKRENIKAFTIKYNGIVKSLVSEIGVSEAYDPKSKKLHPRIYNTNAIWDTGATNSVISKRVVDELKLIPFSKTQVQGVGGMSLQNVYFVNILLPNGVGKSGVRVTEGNLGEASLLIGMDIITLGDFSVSNFENKTTFTFRIPSQKSNDYVNEANKSNQAVSTKISRNAQCPCGSGKKYKQCCGKNF